MNRAMVIILFVILMTLTLDCQGRDLYSDTWVAADSLGRPLPDYNECGPVRSNKTVGIFYWLWHYESYPGPYDVSQILIENFLNPQWGPVNTYHHWGQPELGYYDSADPYVLCKHASMLSDAGIDVVIFDTTNSPFTWQDKYMALCSEFMQIRSLGGQTPQIAFLTPFGDPRTVVQSLYDNLYKPLLYNELWFQWDGKPLIMANPAYFTGLPDILNFFTFRNPVASYYSGPSAPDQWGWLEVYPQHGFYDSDSSLEQVTVGVAQNAVINDNGSRPAFMSHKDGAMGRSWHNESKEQGIDAVQYGYNFAEQWQRALNLDPEFIFITGWNEWTAMRFTQWAGFTAAADSYHYNAMFVDQYSQEYSRDVEPMVDGHTDNYYYQMIANIRRFKGVAQQEQASNPTVIAIDGSFDEWDDVVPEFRDTICDTIHRSYPGYGSTYYTNTTGRNDIVNSKVVFDAYKLYFYVETTKQLTSHTDDNWMILYIDSDHNFNTGWQGYDYMINRHRSGDAAAIEKCLGGWNWQTVDFVPYSYADNKLEIAIPRSLIDQNNKKQISFDFHWTDNVQADGNIAGFLTTGDSAPNRRFNYRYQKDTPAWYFQTDGDFEGWAMTNNLINAMVDDGILSCNISGDDSYMINAIPINVDSNIYRYIHIRMKNQTNNQGAQFFWTTVNSPVFDNNKHIDFQIYANDTEFRDYWIDMSGHAYWNGELRFVRLDPTGASTGHVEIDLVRLQDRLPVCGDMGYFTQDINRDCIVDLDDLIILMENWLEDQFS